MNDYDAKNEIARLKARIRELEAELALCKMPEEASSLIQDLDMVPDAGDDDQVTLDMMDEFIKDMGYQTLVYPESGNIVFTDMFRDYELLLLNDNQIRLSLCEEIFPDADRGTLYLITASRDLSTDVRFDWEKNLVEFSVRSVDLTSDSYKHCIRFFINILNESEYKLYSSYDKFNMVKRGRICEAKNS